MELAVMVGSVALSIVLGLAGTQGLLSLVLSMMERSAPRIGESVAPINTRR